MCLLEDRYCPSSSVLVSRCGLCGSCEFDSVCVCVCVLGMVEVLELMQGGFPSRTHFGHFYQM